MRRTDREVTSVEEKLQIISKCKVCRLALSENNRPYVVPLNFGYEYENDVLTLFFHGAREGKKLDVLKHNAEICFEVDCGHQLIEGSEPCKYSYAYQSVIGFGKVEFLATAGEKSHALNVLLKHQTGKDADFAFDEKHLNAITAYKAVISSFTGKQRMVG